jgi:hypothetical protein
MSPLAAAAAHDANLFLLLYISILLLLLLLLLLNTSTTLDAQTNCHTVAAHAPTLAPSQTTMA